MVPGTGLEPAHLSIWASKTHVSAIPPPGHGRPRDQAHTEEKPLPHRRRKRRVSIVTSSIAKNNADLRFQTELIEMPQVPLPLARLRLRRKEPPSARTLPQLPKGRYGESCALGDA